LKYLKAIMSILKPSPAFQYYLKQWKDLSETEKAPFIQMAQQDKKRYEEEVLEKELEQEKEVIKLQIYLIAHTGGYSAVGLDNGANSYETIGPVVKIIEYSKEEQEKWGVKAKQFQYYGSIMKGANKFKMTLHHNQKYHIRTQWGEPDKFKGENIYTHGTTYNYRKDNPYAPIRKYNICKTTPKHVGTTTNHYTSFNNNTWTTHH
jgi:hypothetical protein